MLRSGLAAALLAASLAACGTTGPTPYQPGMGAERGYSESRIENDRYRISFKGNSMTGRETVENYMLFRAAELTLQNGFDHFTIVNRDTDRERRTYSSGGYMGTYMSYTYFVPRVGWIAAYEPYWTPRRYSEATRYEAYAEILLGRGAKGQDPNTFDARQVTQNLGPTIQRTPAP
jgi:hypothetical protein